jgi:hypothetical protein
VTGQLHASGSFTPEWEASGIHWLGGWVGPRIGLDAVEKRKISCPYRKSNLVSSFVQPVAYLLHWLSYPRPQYRFVISECSSTERLAGYRIGKALDLCSLDILFESRRGHRLYLLRHFPCFLRSLQGNTRTEHWWNHERFLPNPFQSISHSTSRRDIAQMSLAPWSGF